MTELVAPAVVQEFVSRGLSYVRIKHEELASHSQSDLMERLKMAHLELKFALERSRERPITKVSLLQRRMMIKLAFEECRDVLYKHTNEGEEQRLLLSPSLPKRIMNAIKPFFSTEKGTLRASCVRRFEWFAEKADKFVRDVENGCSLARYRFSSPLITQLLEGKRLHYRMVRGNQTMCLLIAPCCLEDYGTVAFVLFDFKDVKTPTKCFNLRLILRLSECTDIVGICTKCLQSLEPEFNHVTDVALGELAQITTQVGGVRHEPAEQGNLFSLATREIKIYRQEPLCCIADEFQPSATNNTPSSELAERFPEQVNYLRFRCSFPAAEYDLRSSNVETNRNTMRAWPILHISVEVLPHFLWKTEDDKVCAAEIRGPLNWLDLPKMATLVPIIAVDYFKLQPERTEFTMFGCLPHGLVTFTVSKPSTEMGYAPKTGDTSKTRRVSKRKR